MAHSYWSYGGGRDQARAARVTYPHLEDPGVQELVAYHPRNEESVVHHSSRDGDTFDASYDQYSHSGLKPSYRARRSTRSELMEVRRHPFDGGRTVEYGESKQDKPLPPDATRTLFVEGLPANVTGREVSHIFRPFPGFQVVRLVHKDSRYPGGDPWVLCFVDFFTESQAAVALDCLQGYVLDELERDSPSLRLQFARYHWSELSRLTSRQASRHGVKLS